MNRQRRAVDASPGEASRQISAAHALRQPNGNQNRSRAQKEQRVTAS